MRPQLSALPGRPVIAIAGTAGYMAMVTLIVTIFTTSGFVAAVAGALTVGLLVGSYLLERWARRRTIYSPAIFTNAEAKTVHVEAADSQRQTSSVDESRMAKV